MLGHMYVGLCYMYVDLCVAMSGRQWSPLHLGPSMKECPGSCASLSVMENFLPKIPVVPLLTSGIVGEHGVWSGNVLD